MKNKLDVAIMKSAQSLLDGTPTADEQKWASAVLANPRQESEKAWRYVLAVNSGLTTAQIESATDAAIQTNVDAVRDALVVAYNALFSTGA